MAAAFGNADEARASHVPVLLRETLRALELESGLTVVDGTVGAGGHSREILKRIGPDGKLIGLDRDPMMLELAARNVTGPNSQLIHASYAELTDVLQRLQIPSVDRVLLDLGLSSDQLADEVRGFGFQSTGPLDMRFDTSRGAPAWQWLEMLHESELADILHKYGEEPYSRRIAKHMAESRATHPIRTAADLAAAVLAALPKQALQGQRKQPAARIFQALRIAVNEELVQLEQALDHVLFDSLASGGIAVIISFHSLEDRLVKQAFRDSQKWQTLQPKPITATVAEQRANPRCRTAKLRSARKL